MQLTNLLLLVGALGAVAHPSGLAHNHHAHHHRRGEAVHIKNVHQKPPTKTTAAPEVAAAAVTPTKAAEPKKEKEKEKPSDEYIPFCGSNTAAAKSKRVTIEQIHFVGNLGMANGCPWNSNLMLVPNNIAHKYRYVQEYINVASEPYEVICANKIGADGKSLTGMFEMSGQTPLRFTLAPGETKTVVADKNTQGVCAFAPGSIPKTPHGQWAGVWAEFDFENSSNNGWSGADCSALVAMHYDMDVPGCRMSEGGVDSTIWPGGRADNAYIRGMEAEDGIGLNIAPGKTTIKVYVGYH
ncbi:hypothetical protein VTJ04DRAFT_1316 [Mycothermus thermophilus]|uniref:uncharacterized protein n=1 Tax=Humicola insolens TaxID=85995 RepID=UPI003743685E